MKKLLLALTASAMTASAMAADVIETQPEGALYDMVSGSTERTFLVYNSMPASTSTDIGYLTEIVVNGQDVYIHNILRDYEMGESWIKGTTNAEGIVEFQFPQTIYVNESTGTEVNVNMLTYNRTGNEATYTISDDNVLRMRWDNWTLTQIKPGTSTENDGLFGLTNANGTYMAYGAYGLELSVVDTAPVALPADADLTETQYTCSFTDKNGDERKVMATIYRDTEGNDVWISGLNQSESKQLVHGEITAEGNIVLESGQFTGITQDYFTYFYGGELDRRDLKWTDNLTLALDGEIYKAEKLAIINQGNKIPLLGYSLTDLVMTPLEAIVQTPADPIIFTEDGLEPEWSAGDEMGVAPFFFSGTDTEGNALDPEKVYYNIFYNGEVQSFMFGDEETAELPWNCDDDYGMVMSLGDGTTFIIFLEEIKTFGVQMIYHNRDEITKSAIVTYNLETGDITTETDGVSDAVTEAEVVREEYYNMQGVRLSEPEGLCIRRTVYTDGTSKAAKIIIRK